MQAVVVTGASRGIGHAITKVLIDHGITVFGSVRNEQDAERLSKEFGQLYVPLIFDITNEEAVQKAALQVRERLQGQTLSGLINNAGVLVGGPLIYLPIEDLRKQLDINLVGQLIVTQAFVPLLGEDKTLTGQPGKIINIGSVSGKIANPFIGPYAISKFGLEAFNDALRMELMIFGIEVVMLAPGAVKSEIWQMRDEADLPEKLRNSVYLRPISIARRRMLENNVKYALPAERIANLALKILRAKKPKLRYGPVPRLLHNWILPMLLPTRLRQRILAKRVQLLKKETQQQP